MVQAIEAKENNNINFRKILDVPRRFMIEVLAIMTVQNVNLLSGHYFFLRLTFLMNVGTVLLFIMIQKTRDIAKSPT